MTKMIKYAIHTITSPGEMYRLLKREEPFLLGLLIFMLSLLAAPIYFHYYPNELYIEVLNERTYTIPAFSEEMQLFLGIFIAFVSYVLAGLIVYFLLNLLGRVKIPLKYFLALIGFAGFISIAEVSISLVAAWVFHSKVLYDGIGIIGLCWQGGFIARGIIHLTVNRLFSIIGTFALFVFFAVIAFSAIESINNIFDKENNTGLPGIKHTTVYKFEGVQLYPDDVANIKCTIVWSFNLPLKERYLKLEKIDMEKYLKGIVYSNVLVTFSGRTKSHIISLSEETNNKTFLEYLLKRNREKRLGIYFEDVAVKISYAAK